MFVSHGGLLGSTEAAHCGVPVVVTPMYGDQVHSHDTQYLVRSHIICKSSNMSIHQFLNAAALTARGMGRIVPYEDLSAETVADAIRFALEPATQEAARKVQYSFRNRQNTPAQTAVWWAEHIAATAGAPLVRSNAVGMSTIAYHSLDVYAFLAVVLLAFVGSWVWIVRRLLGWTKRKDVNAMRTGKKAN